MKRMRRVGGWRIRALTLLDDLERGTSSEPTTMTGLARVVGVSRQTLWRDPAIRDRISKLHSRRELIGDSSGRSTPAERIRRLERELAEERRQNAHLVQNFVNVCRRLHERGLDAHLFLGEAADDLDQLRLEVPRVLDDK